MAEFTSWLINGGPIRSPLTLTGMAFQVGGGRDPLRREKLMVDLVKSSTPLLNERGGTITTLIMYTSYGDIYVAIVVTMSVSVILNIVAIYILVPLVLSFDCDD